MAALKGAFINLGIGSPRRRPNVIVFQFNPEQITRKPALARMPVPNTGAGCTDETQQPGPPAESISFSLRVDATDQRAASLPIAAASGILPTLSALELLMVPKRSPAIDLVSLAKGKKRHQNPPDKLPAVLFFWGPFRILPVSITGLSINETAYDTLLNPIRAEVAVSLEVLTPSQVKGIPLASGAYRYSQGVKEVMAVLNLANAYQMGVSTALSFSL